MRKILFRGKRTDNGEWVYGFPYPGIGLDAGKWFITEIQGIEGSICSNAHEVDPATIGQYTGQIDKTGMKVFEGDIVKYGELPGRYGETHEVVFEQRGGSAYFGIKMSDIETWYFCLSVPAKLMEVIGNIHDNGGKEA